MAHRVPIQIEQMISIIKGNFDVSWPIIFPPVNADIFYIFGSRHNKKRNQKIIWPSKFINLALLQPLFRKIKSLLFLDKTLFFDKIKISGDCLNNLKARFYLFFTLPGSLTVNFLYFFPRRKKGCNGLYNTVIAMSRLQRYLRAKAGRMPF